MLSEIVNDKSKLLKHSRPGVHQKPIDLKSYPDKALCVVKCLEVYIHRTAHLRDCDSFKANPLNNSKFR
jgi:hypothetical protein